MPSEFYIGLISGTSMDGIDAALVEFEQHKQTEIGCITRPWPKDIGQRLRRLSHPGDDEIELMGQLDQEVAIQFSNAVSDLLRACARTADQIKAIGSHGQTIRHRPNKQYPFTLQIGDPNRIAETTGITVVADFRRRDMAAGGEGAPLVPAYHGEYLSSTLEERVVLNLGGIANITRLPADRTQAVIGFDTGPGNTLLDAWAKARLQQPHDDEGRWAAGGTPIPQLLDRLMADPYFSLHHPKSTGPEYFNIHWLKQHMEKPEEYPAQDIQATLLRLTAKSVASAIRSACPRCDRVIACGGGVHNLELMRQLRHQLGGTPVEISTGFGLHPDHVEAMAFAWLARQTIHRRAGNLPSVTGARHPVILGGIYPAGAE